MGLQAAVQLIYPPQCLCCDALVTTDFGLCAGCWRDTQFIDGLVCDSCGTPLPGEDPGHPLHCDDCLATPRPWERGRAAVMYDGTARQLVLGLKHGDRTDLAAPAAAWVHRAVAPILTPDLLVAPVPLHWLKLLKRRDNQAALLSGEVAQLAGLPHCPDLLTRRRNTRSQGGRGREDRFANLEDAVQVHPGRKWLLLGRPVLLVDDVMTSGATLAACARACLDAGASRVDVAVLARVAKEV